MPPSVSGSTRNLTSGAFRTKLGGTRDCFITKLTPTGNALAYSTYFGGSADDWMAGLAVGASGAVTVTGWTDSLDLPTKNAHQDKHAGDADVFVARFSSSWVLEYSTYFGGPARDNAAAVAVDEKGAATFTGHTFSTTGIATAGSFDPTYNGRNDTFVAKLSPSGTLIYGAYLGGQSVERPEHVTLDRRGAATVTGFVSSSSSDFPTTPGAYQRTHGNASVGRGFDCFVTRVSPDGSKLLYSTFLGGTGNDTPRRSSRPPAAPHRHGLSVS